MKSPQDQIHSTWVGKRGYGHAAAGEGTCERLPSISKCHFWSQLAPPITRRSKVWRLWLVISLPSICGLSQGEHSAYPPSPTRCMGLGTASWPWLQLWGAARGHGWSPATLTYERPTLAFPVPFGAAFLYSLLSCSGTILVHYSPFLFIFILLLFRFSLSPFSFIIERPVPSNALLSIDFSLSITFE